MRKPLQLAVAFIVLASAFVLAGTADPGNETHKKSTSDSTVNVQSPPPGETLVVYYFHGNRRCATCRKLEAYSFEALNNDFKSALADSAILWRVVNFETDSNEHFVKDYGLFTQSLILSRVVDGKEVEWKNLDQIWKLVGDKEQYLTYVTSETRDFLTQSSR